MCRLMLRSTHNLFVGGPSNPTTLVGADERASPRARPAPPRAAPALRDATPVQGSYRAMSERLGSV